MTRLSEELATNICLVSTFLKKGIYMILWLMYLLLWRSNSNLYINQLTDIINCVLGFQTKCGG